MRTACTMKEHDPADSTNFEDKEATISIALMQVTNISKLASLILLTKMKMIMFLKVPVS